MRKKLSKAKQARNNLHQILADEVKDLTNMQIRQQPIPQQAAKPDINPQPQQQEKLNQQPVLTSNPWVFKEDQHLSQQINAEQIKDRMHSLQEVTKKLGGTFEQHGHFACIKITHPNGQRAFIIAHLHKIETNDFSEDNIKF